MVAAQAEQRAVHLHGLFIALFPIELAGLERLARVRERELATLNRRELLEEFGASLRHRFRELRLVIGEIEERLRRSELLALKQHRKLRLQQQESGHGAMASAARELADSLAAPGVRDLIVILQIADEAPRRKVERRRAARFFLPRVELPLVEKAVL